MLIDALTKVIEKSGCVRAFWGKLDAGTDAALGIVSSARPFFAAARFAHAPQPTLVVVPGEDAADAFARTIASYVGEEAVLRFPERTDRPQQGQKADPRVIATRLSAADALRAGRAVIVGASAVKNAIMLPVQTIMLAALFAALLPILHRMGFLPNQAGRLRLWKAVARMPAGGAHLSGEGDAGD